MDIKTLSRSFKLKYQKIRRYNRWKYPSILESKVLSEKIIFNVGDKRYIESGGLDELDMIYLNSLNENIAVKGRLYSDPHKQKMH